MDDQVGGWPSRPGIICPDISRPHASSIASWRRWAAVRVSSGPAFCPRASSTTVRAAAQAGVRSPWSRPAPPKVVSSHSARSSNRSSPVSAEVLGAFDHFPGQPGQVMLIRAAQHRREQDPVRVRPQILGELIGPVADQPGQRHRQLPRGERGGDHRGGAAEPPRPSGRRGGGAPVTRVMARSHAAAPYRPSASYPRWAVNAERIFARAAVCWASAASSPVSAAACAAVPSDPRHRWPGSRARRGPWPAPARYLAGTVGPVVVHIGAGHLPRARQRFVNRFLVRSYPGGPTVPGHTRPRQKKPEKCGGRAAVSLPGTGAWEELDLGLGDFGRRIGVGHDAAAGE